VIDLHWSEIATFGYIDKLNIIKLSICRSAI